MGLLEIFDQDLKGGVLLELSLSSREEDQDHLVGTVIDSRLKFAMTDAKRIVRVGDARIPGAQADENVCPPRLIEALTYRGLVGERRLRLALEDPEDAATNSLVKALFDAIADDAERHRCTLRRAHRGPDSAREEDANGVGTGRRLHLHGRGPMRPGLPRFLARFFVVAHECRPQEPLVCRSTPLDPIATLGAIRTPSESSSIVSAR